MPVFRVGDGQRGRRRVPVAPVDGRTGAIDVESQPEHGVRLVELDVFRQDRALFPGDAHAEVQIVREVRFVWETVVKKIEGGLSHSRLNLWRAVVLLGACASILLRNLVLRPRYRDLPPS